MKYLFIPAQAKAEILAMNWGNPRSESGKVSDRTLEAALQYKTNSGLAKMLRAAAMQRGGVVYDRTQKVKKYIPDCVSNIDNETGVWTFVFSGVVTLVWKRETQTVELSSTQEPAQIWDNIITIDDLMELQYVAEQVAEDLQNKLNKKLLTKK